MTDRELLERAARAAGYIVEYDEIDNRWAIQDRAAQHRDNWARWNPLADDGDALRLAVKLQLSIGNDHVSSGSAYCTHGEDADMLSEVRSGADESEVIPSDYAATRRAIVVAAAALATI